MTTPVRAYDKVRKIIERRGGTMTYEHPEGVKYGAWIIALEGKTKTIKAQGNKSFPELDRLHVPKVVEPKTWEDTHNELLDDAEEHLLSLLK